MLVTTGVKICSTDRDVSSTKTNHLTTVPWITHSLCSFILTIDSRRFTVLVLSDVQYDRIREVLCVTGDDRMNFVNMRRFFASLRTALNTA